MERHRLTDCARPILRTLLAMCFVVGITDSANGQKQYAWCPNEVSPVQRPDALRDLVVDIVFTDARVFTSKVKNKCDVTTIANAFVGSLRKAFPNASIALANSSNGRALTGRILIELSLTGYSSTFLSANWTSTVSLSLKVTDSRGDSLGSHNHQIAKEKKAFNMGGMSTAKKNLTLAYIDATAELIDYLATLLK